MLFNVFLKKPARSTDKARVQATREFLHSILNSADYLPNVTFVPHKLVVKGAGKKVSNRITEAAPSMLAANPPRKLSDASSIGHMSEGRSSLCSTQTAFSSSRGSTKGRVPQNFTECPPNKKNSQKSTKRQTGEFHRAHLSQPCLTSMADEMMLGGACCSTVTCSLLDLHPQTAEWKILE